MRTLASAFSTKEQAEAAVRRLEGIGIARERIILKDVEPPADGSAVRGGAFFVSVKVPTDQVRSVSEILEPGADAAPEVAPRPAAPPPPVESPRPFVPPHRGEAQQSGRPLPAREPGFAPLPAEEEPRQAPRRVAARERGKQGRLLVLYGLALVVAFIIGAWLGMAS